MVMVRFSSSYAFFLYIYIFYGVYAENFHAIFIFCLPFGHQVALRLLQNVFMALEKRVMKCH